MGGRNFIVGDSKKVEKNFYFIFNLKQCLPTGSDIKFLVIMNRKNENIAIKSEQGLEEETNEAKIFKQDIFKIDYRNTSKIFYQEPPESSDVKINNYLCYQEDKRLHKVTEIIYEDKLIRIQDFFQVNLDYEKVKKQENALVKKKEKNNNKSIEKIRIFSKDALRNKKSSKTDKKNIVKNIVKIFLSWLEKHSSGQQYIEALEELKIMLENQNFNNRLIKKIVSHHKIDKVFLEFISNDAEQEIKYSRIQDKSSHYEALKLYRSLITDGNSSNSQNQKSNSIEESSEQMQSQEKISSLINEVNVSPKEQQNNRHSIITKDSHPRLAK